MIYHNTSLRAPLRRPVRDFPSWASKPHLTTENRSEWRRWFLRPWIVMQPAAWRPVSVRSHTNCQKNKNIWLSRKLVVNGQAIYCRIVKRWRNIGAQPWPGSRGWNPFARTLDKRQSAKRLYIHRVALLPLNLRTVSPIYGETSKSRCFYFWFYKFRSQSQLTCLV